MPFQRDHCRYRSFNGSCLSARGLYRRSGFSPCPEDMRMQIYKQFSIIKRLQIFHYNLFHNLIAIYIRMNSVICMQLRKTIVLILQHRMVIHVRNPVLLRIILYHLIKPHDILRRLQGWSPPVCSSRKNRTEHRLDLVVTGIN